MTFTKLIYRKREVTPIALYDGKPSTADKTFSIFVMCEYVDGNLNSAFFIATNKRELRGVSALSMPKSLVAHTRLAREARELAEKAKKK